MWDCGSWHAGFSGGMGFLSGVFGLVLFLLIGYLVFIIIQSFTQKPSRNNDKNDSLVILKSRLAEGAISQKEYQEIKEVLLR